VSPNKLAKLVDYAPEDLCERPPTAATPEFLELTQCFRLPARMAAETCNRFDRSGAGLLRRNKAQPERFLFARKKTDRDAILRAGHMEPGPLHRGGHDSGRAAAA
jgi:hypothetical protein